MTVASLSEGVLALVEREPVEDVARALVGDKLPGVRVVSRIPGRVDSSMFPMLMMRSHFNDVSLHSDDSVFLGRSILAVHTFTEDSLEPGGMDGDEQGSRLSEAVRVLMREAHREKPFLPGLGTVTGAVLVSPPRRVADWATATGPVQYADLPAGTWRYETLYRLSVRPPGR